MPSSLKQFNKGIWVQDILILSLFLSLLFGLFLGSRPLSTPDEARYAEIPREMLVLHDFITPHLYGVKYFEKPPLMYWVQAASIKLFAPTVGKDQPKLGIKSFKSISEWAVRIPNALIALFGCLYSYLCGRYVFDRKTGLLGAIILATSFLYFALARIVTLDMALTVMVSSCLLNFLMFANASSESHKCFFWCGSWIFAGLGVLTKGLIGIIFPSLIIGLWILVTQEWALLKRNYMIGGFFVFLLIVLPWHIAVQLRNPGFFKFYFLDQQFLRFTTLIAQRYQPNWFFIPILLLGFLPWTIFLPQAIKANFPKLRLPIQENKNHLFLLIWASIVFSFFSFSHSKLIPYILPIFPALALLTGHYIAMAGTKKNLGIQWGIFLLPIIWLTLGIGVESAIISRPINSLIPTASLPFLIAGYFIFLMSSLLSAFYYIRGAVKKTFIALALGSAVSFIIFATCIPHIDTRTVKPLAQKLTMQLQPQDVVVAYNDSFYDLPFYLNRKVLAANVGGELTFGMQHQVKKGWIISKQDFWRLWHGPKHIYMITKDSVYQNFKQDSSVHFLAATQDYVLLSNHPTRSSSPN